ncbi:MAG: hypothetical protein C5B50_01285 [Verrucomicrobia bacterium]|nr:MAG: hypothetical protein C5B50_01285 [Verrucomicrobiota bacterium]
MDSQLVSIVVRSFNEGWALRDTLPAITAQEYKSWELIVIDSGSTDGSAELIRKAHPRHFIQIEPGQYNPSRVLNLGMQLARSEFGIFLNADATPQGTDWLRPMVMALQDPQTAAVFGRQVPRLDCQAVFAHDYERCFGPNRESTRWPHFFSMVSSGLRKDIWAKRGFLETMQYSEDDEYTRWCRTQGYNVVYCPKSVVMHSHNYTPDQAYRRSFGEARALAAVWDGNRADVNWPRTVLLGWVNDVRRDAFYCARQRRIRELPHAAQIRWRQRKARLAGFRAGWEFYRAIGDPMPGGGSSSATRIESSPGSTPVCEASEAFVARPARSAAVLTRRSPERARTFQIDREPAREWAAAGEDARAPGQATPETCEALGVRRIPPLSNTRQTGTIRTRPQPEPRPRFTIDGSEELEEYLNSLCERVSRGIQVIIPSRRLDAIVLGGGYGRGEGGVLKTEQGDQPYNDLEFYVFTAGNSMLNERRYGARLESLSQKLSSKAGLHVEFKIASLAEFERGRITMYSHDLVAGHHIVRGPADLFKNCRHHLKANEIPPSEATRLLLNRCTGLLLAKGMLRRSSLDPEQADFIGRNIAKAQLALGDAILAAFGQYDQSCIKRHKRLADMAALIPEHANSDCVEQEVLAHGAGASALLSPVGTTDNSPAFQRWVADGPSSKSRRDGRSEGEALSSLRDLHHSPRTIPALKRWAIVCRPSGTDDSDVEDFVPHGFASQLLDHHAAGVKFKLQPVRHNVAIDVLKAQHHEICVLALRVWLWLESRRLDCSFSSARAYSCSTEKKLSGTSPARNWLLNLRTFGPRGALSSRAFSYPRERLLNTLPLLLWEESLEDAEVVRHLQNQLETQATEWDGWVSAYKAIWQRYG